MVGLSSVCGRVKIPFPTDLLYREGQLWFHVVVTLPDAESQPWGEVVGVGMGLSRPAVCSNNRFFGKGRWREIERRYSRLRRSLQRKGTRSARRHLRKLAGKVDRFRPDCDHVLSRRIVDSVQPGTVIVVKNLGGIRSRTRRRGREWRRRLHSWSFRQLRSFLTHKAEAIGCRVAGVDPRPTWQMRSRCRYTHRSSRTSHHGFGAGLAGLSSTPTSTMPRLLL